MANSFKENDEAQVTSQENETDQQNKTGNDVNSATQANDNAIQIQPQVQSNQLSQMEAILNEVIQHRELFHQEYTTQKKELEQQTEEMRRERVKLENLKLEIGTMYSSMKKMHDDVHTVSLEQAKDVAELEKVKMEAIEEMKRFVDEAKARLQVCGKLEVEALENEGRVVKEELREMLDGAKREVQEEKDRALIEVKSAINTKTNVNDGMNVESIDKEGHGNVQSGLFDTLDKENAKPSSNDNSLQSNLLRDDSKPRFKTANSPDTSMTADESNDSDTNSFDDDESLLNNSSLAPPPKRDPSAQPKRDKSAASVHSARTAPRPGVSVSTSTTPFSKKATPRIQNSYTKNKGLNVKLSDSKISPVVNSEKMEKAIKVSSAGAVGGKILKASPIPDKSANKVRSAVKASKSKTTPRIKSVKKRSLSEVKASNDPSPRRSKRLRESARVEQKQALKASLSQDSIMSRQVTPKEDILPPTKSIRRIKCNGKTPSPMVSFKSSGPNDTISPNDKSAPNDSNDLLLGKSVLVGANQDQDIGLDGCESIVQRDVGPLAVPWGARSGAVKSRKKSFANGRKRDRKLFSFETVSSIFDFKF